MSQKLSALPLKAKFKFGSIYDEPIVWIVGDKNHNGYPDNSVTLITDQNIKKLCFDAKEPNNSMNSRKDGGNNRYIYSNVRQWLNSDAGEGQWYIAQHSADAPPNDANVNVYGGVACNPYDTIAGFLNGFTSGERELLLSTTITVSKFAYDGGGGGTETCVDKIFLMSCSEVGVEGNEVTGSKFPIFSDDSSRATTNTDSCESNSNDPNPDDNYMLRDASYFSELNFANISRSGSLVWVTPSDGRVGLRPVCNLSGDILVSDNPDGDGCYVIYVNAPPAAPTSISFGDPHAGKSLQITCEASIDPDGNPITYIWERQIDSGGWTQIGSGASTSIADTVPSSGTNINYRVKARDSEGAESGYRTGLAKAIIYNQPPTTPGVPQYKYPIPGEEMPVKWQASTDPENRTVTYIVETKLGDGEWTQARETPETSCLVNVSQVSAAETMIIVRVKAKDQEGAESAYSTGEAAEILYHKVIRKIPWQRGKPFKARQYTYNGKKQYQTMREGALAGIEAEP